MFKQRIPSVLVSSLLTISLLAQGSGAFAADMTAQIQDLVTNKSFIRAGSALFETDDLAKFYALRNYQPVWTENGVATPFAEALKQAILKLSQTHGLIASDYWTQELESYYKNLNEQNAAAFEMAATEAYLLLGAHLSDGRIDPTFIDNDVRFKRRPFKDHTVMAQAVSATPGMMADIVESLAPQHFLYKNTTAILAQLRQIKAAGGFKVLKKPSAAVKVGGKSSAIAPLRERLKQQGYSLTGAGDVYDAEMALAVQDMQKEHGFEVSEVLKPDSGIWGVLMASVDSRIAQVEATLEKLRWFPKQLEPNMILVNTNATEVKVFENGQVINQFRSINGRVLRRTPMFKVWITRVIFNPKWTATDSVVLQDKLPEIIKDPGFLAKIRMRAINRKTGQVVDPYSLDWAHDGRRIAREHMFVMDPGPKNALGTFKFPLAPDPKQPNVSNSDDIFMHFTDDPSLFAKPGARHLSSGCIRLEKAQWLAGYLLRNTPGYDPETIQRIIAKGIDGEVFDTDKQVQLPESEYRPVYTVPLTVEMTGSGKPRFLKDSYLHDRRIMAAVMSTQVRSQAVVAASATAGEVVSTGLKVIGTAGRTQQFSQVIAVRCDNPLFSVNARTEMRVVNRQCDKPVQFSLNAAQSLPAGRYIVGFENSIFPGFVDIKDGEVKTIQLQKIEIPKTFAKESTVKVYRDFTNLTEQKKVYFEKYFFGRNLFRQTIRSFGDFYLAGINDIDMATPAMYSYCSENRIDKLRLVTDIREHAKFVCESFNAADSMMDYADLYKFDSKGGYQEAVADYPGDVIPKKMLRHLVATPMKPVDFVSVMPGVYRVVGESGKTDVRVTSPALAENYPSLERTFANSEKGDEDDDTDLDTTAPGAAGASGAQVTAVEAAGVHPQCARATVWRTEKRSYCSSDTQDGCNRSLAQACEEMSLDLRFRK